MRFAYLLSFGLIGWAFLLIRDAMPRLPSRIPIHFRADGTANGWGTPQELWRILAMQVVVTLLLLVLPLLCRSVPSLVHIGRRKLADFSPESREQVLSFGLGLTAMICLCVNAMFTYAIHGIIRASFEPGRGLPTLPMWIFLAAILGVFAWAAWKAHQLARIQ